MKFIASFLLKVSLTFQYPEVATDYRVERSAAQDDAPVPESFDLADAGLHAYDCCDRHGHFGPYR